MKAITLSTVCAITLGTSALRAQIAVWDANLTTAVPQFSSAGTVRSMTFDGGPMGKGVQPRPWPDGIGTFFLYVPVTAPNNSLFECIGLRAEDSSNFAQIRAEFFRQPRFAAGPAQLLGSVGTNNSGFQYVEAPFAAVLVTYPTFTYPERMRAYDVSLLTACNTGGHISPS